MAIGNVLYLVRHGESEGNVNPGLRRSDDPPLTERGRAQASRAAAALAELRIEEVCSSPLRRARETAAVIAAASGLVPGVVEGFDEVDMGTLSDSETSEDRAAVVRRVREGLRVLATASPGRRIALITHRIPIAAAAALSEKGGAAVPAGGCPNGSITTLESRDGERWRLVAWGEVS